MPKERRSYTGAEKMAILREHLIEKAPISEVCEKHGLQPTVFYGWQKRLFEEGAAVFESTQGGRAKSSRRPSAQARRIEALEAKLRHKDEVMAELLGEHVALKKSLGEI
jgi:transposase